MPRSGKIHLGYKDPKKNGAPTATDHFVVPPEVAKVYGDNPKELKGKIPVEDEEYWASQYYRAYSQTRGLVCRGDGETCRRMIDTKTGEMANRNTKTVVWREAPCTGQECPYYKKKQCREVMNLQFLLPDVPGLGVWQIDTSSPNSIRNINSFAELMRGVCGRIRMLPLILSLEAEERQDPNLGKKRNVFILHLRHGESLHKLLADSRTPVHELLAPAPVEDEKPLDAEPEIVPDTEQAEQDAKALWPGGEEPEPTATEEQPHIDLEWLKESLTTLQGKGLKGWSNTSVLSYLKTTYKVEAPDVFKAVQQLEKGQATHFVKKVQEALDLA